MARNKMEEKMKKIKKKKVQLCHGLNLSTEAYQKAGETFFYGVAWKTVAGMKDAIILNAVWLREIKCWESH